MPRSPVAGLGVGAGWRAAAAEELLAQTRAGMRFSEVVAENLDPERLPGSLLSARRAGLTVIPHGVTLSLAGGTPPDRGRVAHLAALARALDAPLVSEHVAFVRAGAGDGVHGDVLEAGHLVPAARTAASLAVLVDNVRAAQAQLPVPLALENIAATLAWPETTLDEADFLHELVEATGCLLVLDVANAYATCSALGGDPFDLITRMPLDRVAYVHVAGGEVDPDGVYLDTHAHALTPDVLALLARVDDLLGPDGPPVLLERDSDVTPEVIRTELDRVREALGAIRVST